MIALEATRGSGLRISLFSPMTTVFVPSNNLEGGGGGGGGAKRFDGFLRCECLNASSGKARLVPAVHAACVFGSNFLCAERRFYCRDCKRLALWVSESQ